jgi:hypothetical protein
MLPKGWAQNAVCPKCQTYTIQRIVKRGLRKCECGMEFTLQNTKNKPEEKLMKQFKENFTPGPWETCRVATDMNEWGVHAPEHPKAIKSGKEPPEHMAHAITICRGMTGPNRIAN